MEVLVVSVAALFASGLTLFSGFGLGTLLTPVFAVFFPLEVAVAQTALVHFANNCFKLALIGRRADLRSVLLFGLPAFAAAFLGARALLALADLAPLASYGLWGHTHNVRPIGLVVAALMACFAVLELRPVHKKLVIDSRWLPVGGLLSGFFGGLSGNQGAFRSAFLLQAGLSKESFIATGVVIACLVDLSRLSIYTSLISRVGLAADPWPVTAATLSAFLGAFLGVRLLGKTTIETVRVFVGVMLFVLSLAIGSGLV